MAGETPRGPRPSGPAPGAIEAENAALRNEIALLRAEVARLRGAGSTQPARVGLFVDVQNMYYAARQIGARLDFGALMAAVTRDRRLIKATAYVVRNRDIDQSGFLSMLQ